MKLLELLHVPGGFVEEMEVDGRGLVEANGSKCRNQEVHIGIHGHFHHLNGSSNHFHGRFHLNAQKSTTLKLMEAREKLNGFSGIRWKYMEFSIGGSK